MKKIIEVTELIKNLQRAGLEAGICAAGSSSYPLIELAGDLEIWAYVPSNESTSPAVLEELSKNPLDIIKAASTLGRIKSERKAAAVRENGKLGGRLSDSKILHLENPWSGAVKEMTWGEVKAWCAHNVHPTDQERWLKAARSAAKTDDGKTLGEMIIGS